MLNKVFKYLMLVAGVACISSHALASNVSMYIDNFTIKGGETKTLAINLTNDVEITAFQCDVYLPDGLSFVFNEDEESYNWLNYDRAAKKHVYEGAIQADGALRSLVYHLSSTAFKGNSGKIIYFDVKADDSFAGEHTIELKNVECTQPDGTKILPTPTCCTVIGEVEVVNVSSISVDKTSTSITLGETVTLTATVLPDNATDKSVVWSSSDESIATVDNGVVTAVAPGVATITVTTTDGSNLSATCDVEVLPILVASISLDQVTASINPGETVTLTATVLPDNATDKSVVWSSSDESIATVDNGVVTAVAPGMATITATTTDGTNLSATCEITISSELTLTLIDGEGGKFELVEQYGEDKKVKMIPTVEWEINTVTFNGEDVTNEIDDEGVLTISLVENSVINVVYEKINTSVQQIEMNAGNPIHIYVKDDTVNVVGADEDSNVMIFGVDGLNIYNGNEKTISIDEQGVYILTVDNRTFKFAL